MRSVRGVRHLQTPSSLRAWLYSVVHGIAVDYIRRDVARGQAEEKHSEELDETFEDPFCNDDADQIHSALDQLEPRQREVLILHFLEEFSVAQIAHIVNCPEGTVKSRIHYAKKAMKTILRGTYEKL